MNVSINGMDVFNISWDSRLQTSVWNVLHAPLEVGALFCIATRPPVAQMGFAFEPLWAQTGWTLENFLGQHVMSLQDSWQHD